MNHAYLRTPSPLPRAKARAEPVSIEGRLLRFSAIARDGDDRIVAVGDVSRAVVERERFLARL